MDIRFLAVTLRFCVAACGLTRLCEHLMEANMPVLHLVAGIIALKFSRYIHGARSAVAQ